MTALATLHDAAAHLGCQLQNVVATKRLKDDVCLALYDLARTSFGPHGRAKVVKATSSSGSSLITSVSGRLGTSLSLQDYISRFLMQSTLIAQYNLYGDGGLLSLLVSSRLIRSVNCANIPVAHAVAGLQLGIKWTLGYLEGQEIQTPSLTGGCKQHCCYLDVTSAHASCFIALVRSVISPKPVCGLDGKDIDCLCVTVVEAFFSSLSLQNTPPSLVKVTAAPGLPCRESFVIQGVAAPVILTDAAAVLLPCKNVVAAVFNISLDIPAAGQGTEVAETSGAAICEEALASGCWSAQQENLQELLQLAPFLHSLGVQVVVCQKGIHPALQQALLQHNIIPIHRLSVVHIGSLAEISGSILISSINTSPGLRDCLGMFGSISQQEVGKKMFLVFKEPQVESLLLADCHHVAVRLQPVQTLLLGCIHDSAGEELKVLVESSLKVLRVALQEPKAVPGGGCTESFLAHMLRSRLQEEHVSHKQALAIKCLADALAEAANLHLPCTARLAADEVWEEQSRALSDQLSMIRLAGDEQLRFHGYLKSEGQLLSVATGSIDAQSILKAGPACELLDLLAVKRSSLSKAVDAACVALRIQGVIAPTEAT